MLYQRVVGLATWPTILLLTTTGALCHVGFSWRKQALGQSTAMLDGRRWYTPADAQQLLANLGAAGRRLYAVTELTLDMVFPLVYGGLFAALIAIFCGPKHGWALLIPLLAVGADLVENSLVAYLALSFDGSVSQLAWIAAVCTATKWTLATISLLIVVFGGILTIWSGVPRS